MPGVCPLGRARDDEAEGTDDAAPRAAQGRVDRRRGEPGSVPAARAEIRQVP